MRLISQQIGLADEMESFLLADNVGGGRQGGVQITSKTTPEVKRIVKSELEQTYINNPIIFNSINKTVQLILSAGYKLVGEPDIVNQFQEWLDTIGEKGGELEWNGLLERDFLHIFVFGDAWNELIYNVGKDNIVDLDTIDPKKMDYAKTGMRKIALDKYSNPLGYIEKLPMDMNVQNKIKPPAEVSLDPAELFLPPERIAHFKLYTIGDGFYPVGLIEPIYNTSFRKLKMEQAIANSWWRAGFPLILGRVGDINHEPSEEHLTKLNQKLADLDYRSSITVPNYVDVSFIEAKKPEKLKEQLNYFIDQEVAGSGMPKPLATGSGEATNRSVLERQEYLLKVGLKNAIKHVTNVIEKKIFARKAALEGLPSYPKMLWGEICLEDMDSRAERLVKYATAGLIKPDAKLEKYIREVENLPDMGV